MSTQPMLAEVVAQAELAAQAGPAAAPATAARPLDERNLGILSWCFFLVFLAFGATQNLESSLHPGAAGTSALGVLYVMLTVAGFAASAVLDCVGSVKRVLTISFATYVVFVLANLVPEWWSLLPAAAVLGIGGATLWNAQGVYLSSLSSNEEQAAIASGTFFTYFQLGQLVGNLLAFGVLQFGGSASAQGVTRSAEAMLFILLAASAAAGTLLSIRLDPLPGAYCAVDPESDGVAIDRGGGDDSSMSDDSIALDTRVSRPVTAETEGTLAGELNMLRILGSDGTLVMLIPMFMYSGAQAAWAWGEFTGFVVKPVLGTEKVPIVMAFFSLSDALSCWALGKLNDGSSRSHKTLLSFGVTLGMTVISCAGLDLFLGLREGPGGIAALVAASCALGFADASCNTLICAVLSSRKTELDLDRVTQLSFAQFTMWQSLATAVMFFMSAHCSLAIKSATTVGLGVVAVISFVLTPNL